MSLFSLQPGLWADDYTAYVANARQLAHHAPYGMPGFIVNTDYAGGADLGQGAYPAGVPLLLVPLVWLAGGSVWQLLTGFALLNTVLLALAAGLFASLAAATAGRWAGLVCGMALGLSPALFDQGALRVPSEPAFLCAFIAALLADEALRHGGGARAAVSAGLAQAATALTRIVAGLLLPAQALGLLIRERRISARLLSLLATAILLLGLGMALSGTDYLTKNAAIFAAHAAAPQAPPTPPILHNLALNLRDLPSNLTVLWDFTWPDPAGPALSLPRGLARLATLVVFIAALAGWLARLAKGPGAAEIFMLLETGFVLTLPELQQSPRYYLPLSVLIAWYACLGAQAATAWLRTPAAGLGQGTPPAIHPRARLRPAPLAMPQWLLPGLVSLGLLGTVCGNLPAALATRSAAARFGMTAPDARAAIDWIKANTPPDAVLLAHRPRSWVLFTGRSATDFTTRQADPEFYALAQRTGAAFLVMATDNPAVLDRAAKSGAARTGAALNLALDSWVTGFCPGSPCLVERFRNARFRVFSVARP